MLPQDYKKIKILTYPNSRLRSISKEVDESFFNTDELNRFCQLMKKFSDKKDGLGLAAPQVGVFKRIIYISPSKRTSYFLINPQIIDKTKTMILDSEGCLSVPKVFGTVIRNEGITVKAKTEQGNEIQLIVSGIEARVIQHEIDHLDGILFIDKVVTITDGQQILDSLNKT